MEEIRKLSKKKHIKISKKLMGLLILCSLWVSIFAINQYYSTKEKLEEKDTQTTKILTNFYKNKTQEKYELESNIRVDIVINRINNILDLKERYKILFLEEVQNLSPSDFDSLLESINAKLQEIKYSDLVNGKWDYTAQIIAIKELMEEYKNSKEWLSPLIKISDLLQ